MIVYRIENQDRVGPYRNSNRKLCNIVKNSTDTNNTPMYRGFLRDKLKCDYKEIVYGFDSLERISQWFDKSVLQLLHDNNFSIVRYIVPDWLCELNNMDGQVIFRIADANVCFRNSIKGIS